MLKQYELFLSDCVGGFDLMKIYQVQRVIYVFAMLHCFRVRFGNSDVVLLCCSHLSHF